MTLGEIFQKEFKIEHATVFYMRLIIPNCNPDFVEAETRVNILLDEPLKYIETIREDKFTINNIYIYKNSQITVNISITDYGIHSFVILILKYEIDI